jgi:dTDP-4-amino-4,6-dideoxygalactose transaminase
MLSVAEPSFDQDEKDALAEVIDSGWITMGERVGRFEHDFAQAHQAAGAVAVSSATAGLHLALHALGIGPEDEVLVPSLTFVASANCILYVGATPVFVDIRSPRCPLMSLDDAARKCTNRTRAIILVHYAGYVADLDLWRTFAQSRDLVLVEDAAHAAGLTLPGTVSDAAVFSFYGNKNMTTAEGGMVIARADELRERIRQMRGHCLTSGTFQRHHSLLPLYDVPTLGFNYRLDELRAAIGIVQLRKLRAWNEKRAELTRCYRDLLGEECPEVVVPSFDGSQASSNHIMPVLLPSGANRPDIVARLRASGIQTSMHYPPVHLLSLYRERYPGASLPETETFAAREITLPLHPRLEIADIAKVSRSLAGSLAMIGVGAEP